MGLSRLPFTEQCESYNHCILTPRCVCVSSYSVYCVQAFELMCVGEWSDVLLELELLTRIARLALLQGNYHLV